MITLTKDLEVGVVEIDAQHRELIDRLNRVVAMGSKSVSHAQTQETLHFLGEYVVKHFRDEEVLQKLSDYPKYAWHKDQHQIFIGHLQALNREFAENGSSAKFTLDLNKSIIHWIVRHIKSVDVEFGKYYQLRMSQAKPGAPRSAWAYMRQAQSML